MNPFQAPEVTPAPKPRRRRRWIIGISVVLAIFIIGLFIAASVLSRRFEPYVREQAILYLEKRFNSDVHIARLRLHMPKAPVFRVLADRGRGVVVRVDGEGIVLKPHGRPDAPPLFTMRKFAFDFDLGTLFEPQKRVQEVRLEGLEINVPPKGERPSFRSEQPASETPGGGPPSSVRIDHVVAQDAVLRILPKDPTKRPLIFDIHSLHLRSGASAPAMNYEAELRNAKPPGEIKSTGTFGPWAAEQPGDTPLGGSYTFANADLGVFRGIAGTLQSTGQFEGTLSSITAKGEATVPNFRLTNVGNPVPLWTKFEVLVDGTNGNTVLKPVVARLGSTNFRTSGAVLKEKGDLRRRISLNVNMPNGNLRDVLRLATKGAPFMEGRLLLQTRIDIPPLAEKVKDKLLLDGKFSVMDGKFLKSNIQDQIDGFSRRAQGQPKNDGIDEVVHRMTGKFRMEDQVISFQDLSFGIPGADVDLAGYYDSGADNLDFRGTLRMKARVSQTMTGWKRWALKPVDPFFAKNGAGTFLKIKVDGTAKEPKFGLDRGKPQPAEAERARTK